MNSNWVIGVGLAALGSFVSNLGVTLQKLHHLQCAQMKPNGATKDTNDNGHKTVSGTRVDHPAAHYYKQSLWRIGLALVVVGSVADFVALSFAPQSLVAPLGSLTLVSNVIFAPLLLKEKITRRDLIATITIVTGSAIAVSFASHDDVTYQMVELFTFFFRLPFLFYITAVLLYVSALLSFVRHMNRLESDLKAVPSLLHTDSRYIGYDRLRYLLRFAYPSMSGTIGAQSVLFAKCTAELLTNTSQGNGFLFAHYQTYLVLFGMGTTVFLQIKWLNEGLMRFAASYTVPVFMAFWIVLSVLSGLVFYSEYYGMTSMQLSMFAFGVMMTVAGVVTLSKQSVDKSDARHVTDNHQLDHDEVTRDIDPILVANIGKALAAGANVMAPPNACSNVMNISVAVDNATGRLMAKVSTASASASSAAAATSSTPSAQSHQSQPSDCPTMPIALPVTPKGCDSSSSPSLSLTIKPLSMGVDSPSSSSDVIVPSSASASVGLQSPSRWPAIPPVPVAA